NGDHQGVFRPALFSMEREGGSGKQMSLAEADLSLLDLDRGLGKGRIHTGKESLVEGELRRPSVKEKEYIALVVLGAFHVLSSFQSGCSPGSQLPEGHGAGRRHIEGVHLVGHGDTYGIVAPGDGAG